MDALAELDIKQHLSRLTESDRRAISVFLLKLKHASEEGVQESTRMMKEMDGGIKTKLSNLKETIFNG